MDLTAVVVAINRKSKLLVVQLKRKGLNAGFEFEIWVSFYNWF